MTLTRVDSFFVINTPGYLEKNTFLLHCLSKNVFDNLYLILHWNEHK